MICMILKSLSGCLVCVGIGAGPGEGLEADFVGSISHLINQERNNTEVCPGASGYDRNGDQGGICTCTSLNNNPQLAKFEGLACQPLVADDRDLSTKTRVKKTERSLMKATQNGEDRSGLDSLHSAKLCRRSTIIKS